MENKGIISIMSKQKWNMFISILWRNLIYLNPTSPVPWNMIGGAFNHKMKEKMLGTVMRQVALASRKYLRFWKIIPIQINSNSSRIFRILIHWIMAGLIKTKNIQIVGIRKLVVLLLSSLADLVHLLEIMLLVFNSNLDNQPMFSGHLLLKIMSQPAKIYLVHSDLLL